MNQRLGSEKRESLINDRMHPPSLVVDFGGSFEFCTHAVDFDDSFAFGRCVVDFGDSFAFGVCKFAV